MEIERSPLRRRTEIGPRPFNEERPGRCILDRPIPSGSFMACPSSAGSMVHAVDTLESAQADQALMRARLPVAQWSISTQATGRLRSAPRRVGHPVQFQAL